MVSDSYVQNIIDRSVIEWRECYKDLFIMICKLPNGFAFSEEGANKQECVRKVKTTVKRLETYLEADKVYYNYDLEEEFINE